MSFSLRCPICHSSIQVLESATCANGHLFVVDGGTINFLGNSHSNPLDGHLVFDHACEKGGQILRLDNYVIPWLRNLNDLSNLRVLDNGCGNGQSIKHLIDVGIDAYGVDPGQRTSQWSELNIGEHLFIADGTKLPFPNMTFDAIVSFGVIEHVGEGIASSRRAQDPYQQSYVNETIRVLKKGGRALIAAPNGAFPIDFWHAKHFGARLHRPYEHWMPTAPKVRRWAHNSPEPVSVRFLTPQDYLSFQRVKQHWYGRVLGGSMKAVLTVIDKHPSLSTSIFNPFLIAEITRL